MKFQWKILAVSAGALAVLGIYCYYKSRSSHSELVPLKIMNKKAYQEISTKMREYFKEKYNKSKAEYRSQRRNLDRNSPEYQKLVLDFNLKVKDLVGEAQEAVLKDYYLSKTEFENSVNYYDLDPEMRVYAEGVVDTNIEVQESQLLGLEETRKILNFYHARLKEYESECPELEDYMIINTKIEDEVFEMFHVEMEVVTASWEANKNSLEDVCDQLRNQTYCVLASTESSF